MLECYAQVANVIAGKTADGHPGSLPKLPLKIDSTPMALASTMARAVLARLATPEPFDILSDGVRTAVCWKSSAYISKVGPRLFNVQLSDNAIRIRLLANEIAEYLTDHPRLVVDKTGFARIIELVEEQKRRAEAAVRKAEKQRMAECITDMRVKSGAPPRPVAWAKGEYKLEELTHPFHVWEEGIRMHNCLATLSSGVHDFRMNVKDLERLPYWRSIQNQDRHIYSLRLGQKRLATFTHIGTRLTELQISSINRDVVQSLLCEAVDFLETIYGRMTADARLQRMDFFKRNWR